MFQCTAVFCAFHIHVVMGLCDEPLLGVVKLLRYNIIQTAHSSANTGVVYFTVVLLYNVRDRLHIYSVRDLLLSLKS